MPKLTKRLIELSKHPAQGQVFLRDDEIHGFALRVTAGSKTFICEKKIDGQTRRMTLGKFPAITVEQARKIAQEKIGQIASGRNPAGERQARRQAPTFAELERLYLDRHAIHKKSASNDVTMFTKHLTGWRARRLTAITRADVNTRHVEMGATGSTVNANRMIALVRCMFNLAQDWGLHPGPNPAARVKLFKEAARDRFVTPSELPRLWKALHREPNVYVRAAFFIGILTGARRSEVLGMQWRDLDLQQGLWRIPDTKAGRPHTLPLPQPVIDELMKLPRLDGNPHVFCGRWGKSHLVNVAKPWKRIRHEAGLDDVRIHDLRRTLGSWLVAAGASLPLIGKTLNHSQQSTTAIYARLQLDAVRTALDANAARMLEHVPGNTEGHRP
ncbi:MAG: site-specific integrase [Nitrospirales bacterium]